MESRTLDFEHRGAIFPGASPRAGSSTDIWRLGMSLADAAWHFAAPRLRRQHAAARKSRPKLTDTQRQQITNPSSAAEAIENVVMQFEQLGEHLRSQSEAWENIGNELFGKLIDRQLTAVGFSVVNGVASDEPTEIPPFLFDAKFADWQNSKLKGGGREFISVRVVDSREEEIANASAQTETASPINPVARRIGRPSEKENIFRAINTLEADGLDLHRNSAKQNGDLVRRRVSELTGRPIEHLKGVSDETIRRAIVERGNS